MARKRFRPLYFLLLVVTALAVVLIVLIYCGVIVALAYGIFRLVGAMFEILRADSGGEGTPPIAWAVCVVFASFPVALLLIMIKPLIAPKAPEDEFRFKITPGRHPGFDALVTGIAEKMGVRPPTSVIVTNIAGASASIGGGLKGIFGRRLELMIGLPLITCLNTRQLGGIIAHEYGHFSQRVGMRLRLAILNITSWLARTAYAYDKWDLWVIAKLEPNLRLTFFNIIFWISERYCWVLKGIARLADAISSATCRQMEYDADVSEIEFGGSENFSATSIRIRQVDCAFQQALANCDAAWLDRRLPEDFSGFVSDTLEKFSAQDLDKIEALALGSKARWFDSHPSDKARIKRAERLGSDGIFQLEVPATTLFKDFETLAKHVTHNFYDIDLGLEVHRENLVPNSLFLDEDQERIDGSNISEAFYGGSANVFVPYALDPAHFDSQAETSQLWKDYDALRSGLPAVIQERAGMIETFAKEQLARGVQLRSFAICNSAGIHVNPADFGLRNASPATVREARSESDAKTRICLSGMGESNAHYAELFKVVLNLLRREEIAPLETEALRSKFVESWNTTQLLWIFKRAGEALRELEMQAEASNLVLGYTFREIDADGTPSYGIPAGRTIADRLEMSRVGVLKYFATIPYPFTHAVEDIRITDFATLRDIPDGFESSNQLHRARLELMRADYTLRHISTLYFRLLERMAVLAEHLAELHPVERNPTVAGRPAETEVALQS